MNILGNFIAPQKSHGDVQKAFSGRQELHTSCTETMTSGQFDTRRVFSKGLWLGSRQTPKTKKDAEPGSGSTKVYGAILIHTRRRSLSYGLRKVNNPYRRHSWFILLGNSNHGRNLERIKMVEDSLTIQGVPAAALNNYSSFYTEGDHHKGGSRSVSEVKPSSVLHYLAINQVPWIIRWDYGLRVDRTRDKNKVFLVRNYYCRWKYDKSSKMVFLNKRLRTEQNMQGDRFYETLPEWEPVKENREAPPPSENPQPSTSPKKGRLFWSTTTLSSSSKSDEARSDNKSDRRS